MALTDPPVGNLPRGACAVSRLVAQCTQNNRARNGILDHARVRDLVVHAAHVLDDDILHGGTRSGFHHAGGIWGGGLVVLSHQAGVVNAGHGVGNRLGIGDGGGVPQLEFRRRRCEEPNGFRKDRVLVGAKCSFAVHVGALQRGGDEHRIVDVAVGLVLVDPQFDEQTALGVGCNIHLFGTGLTHHHLDVGVDLFEGGVDILDGVAFAVLFEDGVLVVAEV